MLTNPVRWFEIYVQDMPRAKAFYEFVLKTELKKLDAPWNNEGIELYHFPMEAGGMGSSGALVKMEGVPSGGSGLMIYFHCEDCAEGSSRVTQAGGKVFREKMAIGEYGFISIIQDLDGNMIGLHSMI